SRMSFPPIRSQSGQKEYRGASPVAASLLGCGGLSIDHTQPFHLRTTQFFRPRGRYILAIHIPLLSTTTTATEIFVGRHHELARGDHAIEAALRADANKGAVLLFTGEAGIGKTRIAQAIADHAAKKSTSRVVWGRAWEAGGAPAYWPWIQVFRAL